MKKIFTLALFLAIAFSSFAQTVEQDSSSLYIGLDDIKVFASYNRTNEPDPIVLTTIDSEQILDKISNREFPEILRTVPSVFTSVQGGGFGDSRLTLRGFGSENIALLINGIPVNGMENGSIYWSNWAGLSDVTNSIQVQRGIGLSKLGLFSVGGTVNIITQSSHLHKQATAFYGIGNDGYQKIGFSVSSGELPKGWAFTAMGTRTWGNGYVNGTNFEAWNYFANVTKNFKKHRLSLTVFGAPQWHNRRSNKQSIEDYENSQFGIRLNTSYGYINGVVTPTYSGYNEYHKPMITLNHFWRINDKSVLSTAVYVSNATGGGRKVYGKNANMLQYNYKTGKPYEETSLTPQGFIDYEPVMELNRKSDHGSDAIFTMGTNSHDWYGLLSSYTLDINDKFRFTAGIDGRYYRGYHYDKISDLLGGEYFIDNNLAWRAPGTKLKKGDKVNYDYLSDILWAGAFAQGEYNSEHIRAFVSASLNLHSYKRQDPGRYGKYSDQSVYPASDMKTPWRNFVPMSIKGGISYVITPVHSIFVNGGYVTRAPMMDNIYVNNEPISNPVNEKIATFEVGYSLNAEKVGLTLNGYYTKWLNKSVTKPIGNWNGPKACIPNINALHKGIELQVWYRPFRQLSLDGFVSIGDWKWTNDVNFTLVDDNKNVIGEYHAYLKGIHVGNSPQTSMMLNVAYSPLPRLTVGVDCNYYGRYYADFTAADRTNPEDRADSWRIPDFTLFDVNVAYGFKINMVDALLTINVNNVFNKKYITDALDGADHNAASALVWYGFGRTWSVGLRIKI